MGLMGLLQRGVNDIAHPFGIGAPHPAAPAPRPQQQPQQQWHAPMALPTTIRTPAPVQAPNPIVQTPAPGSQAKPADFNLGTAPKIQPKESLGARINNDVNNFANSNFNPSHLVENYAIKPAAEVGSAVGSTIYNRGIAPAANLPKENLGTAFQNSSNPNLRANAKAIANLKPGQQAANVLQLASNAIPGGGEIVDNLAEHAALPVLEKTGSRIAAKTVQKLVQYGGKAALGATAGAGMNAASTATQGGNMHQIFQAAGQGAKFGGILGTALPVAEDVMPHAINGARVAAPVIKNAVKDLSANPMSTPAIRTNLADQKALRAYSTYQTTGKYDVTKGLNKTIIDGQQVLAKHGVSDVRNLTPGAAVDSANAILDTLGRQRETVAQGGYAKVPFLEPGEKSIDPTTVQYGNENSSQQIIKNNADAMYTHDKSMKGGQMIPDGSGGYTRTSEHTPFYSKYYAENGHAPSKAAYATEVQKQLEAGHGDLVPKDEAQAYQLAKDRETSNVAQPAPATSGKTSLPKELAGAKPNYTYGQNRFQLQFPDDVTKSLYIVGGKGQSASHGAYMDFLHQALPDKSDTQLATMGNQVRDGIKSQAKNSTSDTIKVASHPAAVSPKTPQVNPQTGTIEKPALPNKKALTPRSTPNSAMTPIKDALAAKQAKLAAGKPTEEVPVPKAKPLADSNPQVPVGRKQSRFANVTVQNSDKVEPNVKQLVAEQNTTYEPQTVKAGQDAAQQFVKDSGSLTKATNKVLSNIHNTDTGKITRQDVYNAQAVANHLQKTGQDDDAMTAAEIYGRLSEHHTAAGQQIQAAAALAKISPQGLHASAIKAIKNGGKNGTVQKISDDLAGKISKKVDEIAQTPEGSVERDDKVQELQKIVNQNVHHSNGSKVFTLWRTGLLTGPQTMTKVLASHALMAGAEKLKDVPAVAIDKGISGVSQILGKGAKRSTALTLRGEGSGFATGTKAAVKLMRTGLDTKGTGGQGDSLVGKLAHPEVDFGNSKAGKAANFYVQKTGGIHASIPKGFFTAAQSNDLFKQAIAEGKNLGLKGADLQTHVDNYTQGASDFAKQEAQLSAQKASFQQDTTLGHVGRALQGVPGGKWALPFAKIASTILSDAADYSPAGALKAGWQAFKDTKGAAGWTPTIQKHFVEELGRSITGTGVLAAGVALYKHGVMTLGYPTSKPEQAIWKAEGKTPNSILLDGKWRDTSSLGPFGTLLFMGGSVAQSGQHDGKGRSQVGAAVTGALQNITSQSYLSGLTSAANALSQPTEFAGTEEKQLAGSVVPIAVATAARATDPLQRNAPGVAQSVESKIPGARESLTPAQDMFGHQLSRQGGVTTNVLDPSRPSGIEANAQIQELDRLEKTTGTTSVPTAIKTINGKDANGKTVATALSQTQQNAYNTAVGPKIQAAYAQIMNNPNYNKLTDANKVSALNSAKDNIEAVQKAQTLKAINGNTVKLTSAQANGVTPDYVQNKLNEQSGGTSGVAINGKLDNTSRGVLNDYNSMTTVQRTKTMATQNDFAYKYDLAKYNNDMLNGSLTKAGQITAKATLAKDAVGSNYSQDVRQLYGLSKPEIQQFISTDPNGAKYASQLQSYDQALYNAGIIKTRKFASGFGSGGSSGGSSSSAALPSAISYKSSAPKTGLGKFKVPASKAPGSAKAKLVGYSTNNPSKAAPKVGKLPSAPKNGSKPTIIKQPALFKPTLKAITKRKGVAV
jgi:hypothetical protein